MNTGETIKILRRERGLTQQQLADALKISKASVQKYEQGDVLNIKMKTLRELCELLNVSPQTLIFPETSSDISADWARVKKLLQVYGDLNKLGREKVMTYLRDLHYIEKYRKEKD